MKIIIPIPLAASMLVSTVPITETETEYNPATAYATNATCKVSDPGVFRRYKMIAPTSKTGFYPPDNSILTGAYDAAKPTKVWLQTGVINKYAMFDLRSKSPTTATEQITVSITPNQFFNGLAIFDLAGITSMSATVTDPVDGIVYAKTYDLIDLSAIFSLYDWFFEPLSTKRTVIDLEIPPYINSSITLVFTGPGAISVGELAIGSVSSIGTSTYGGDIGVDDFSSVEFDEEANATIKRSDKYSRLITYNVLCKRHAVDNIEAKLSELRATGLPFIGEVASAEMNVFGFYKDFSFRILNHEHAQCSIQVQELA